MQELIRCLINFEEIRGIWPDLPWQRILRVVEPTLGVLFAADDVGGHDAGTNQMPDQS